MKKDRSKFVCQNCGYASPAWLGKCPECGAWNAFVEEIIRARPVSSERARPIGNRPVAVRDIPDMVEKRISTGIGEFDRVLGGGSVPGSVVLVGGSPGMGKSTLMLQAGGALASAGRKVLYVSGEESLQQVKMRAERLSVQASGLFLVCETDVDAVADLMESEKPDIIVVDSVQTMMTSIMEGLPGNVSQVRYCGQVLTNKAKELNKPLFLIGHVTKDGTLAGPRVLEHLVDGLLLFEGDEQHQYRILRSVKNRFGSTNEVGMFEMTEQGLAEIANPSEHLLAQRNNGASGTAVTVSLEGLRPIMVEVQALVTPTGYGIPQRTATGFDQKRLSMLLAVLEKRLGLRLNTQDVFVNAAGGMRLAEPAVDLAVASAAASSFSDKPVLSDAAIFGEIGLTGEVRGVSQPDRRVAEAERLGFKKCVLPKTNLKSVASREGILLIGVSSVREAVERVVGAA
jgi:DNA repair protein RadA/Sms